MVVPSHIFALEHLKCGFSDRGTDIFTLFDLIFKIFSFFSFYSHTYSMWKFQGQGFNLYHSSNLSSCCDARSLTCCSTRELLPYLCLQASARPRLQLKLASYVYHCHFLKIVSFIYNFFFPCACPFNSETVGRLCLLSL